jgi:hypothetical protein
MNDEIALPVNGIIKALRKGSERAQKICAGAGRNAIAAQIAETLEPAQALQKSLAESEAKVTYAYAESMRILGHRYSSALQNDREYSTRKKTTALPNKIYQRRRVVRFK